MAPEFVTIGVYGADEDSFFRTLLDAGVDTFCDIRRRRGLRGSTYAFANARRLQARLADLGIRYCHRLDLAPTQELRAAQNEADRQNKAAKRKRTELGEVFITGYRRQTLADFDSTQFVTDLGPEARVVALFCVERAATACHRSLLAARLEQDLGVSVTHLRP